MTVSTDGLLPADVLSAVLSGDGGDAGTDVVYGLLRLAGTDVALPLSALREVVPCPSELAGLPAVAPGLLGAIELRRLVLPVLDLQAVTGRPEVRRDDQVVVVVASGDQVLGLLADQVQGICQVAADTLVEAHAAGGGLLFSHTFRHPDSGRAYSVLDAAAVLRLPGVPTVTDVTRSASGAVRDGGPEVSRRTLTVLRCGEYRLAVDAAHVHTTIPTPDLRTSVLTSRMCPGTVEYADREVPVVDPLVLLGLGELARADTGSGLVLDLGPGYVVLALSELLELVHVGPDDVLPTPSFALPRPDLLAGMVQVPGVGDCLVLDGDALLADPQLAGFAAVNTALEVTSSADGSTTSAAAAVAAGAPAYLTYSIGLEIATPLEQVSEILPFPETLTRTSVPGLLGLITHRRAVVPVLCLASLIGQQSRPVTAGTCLLLVDVDGEQVAFAVDALRSIDPLTWTDPDQVRNRGADQLERVLQTSPLVQVGGHTRLLPGLDLQRVARAVRGTATVPVPRAPLEAELVAG